MDDRWFRLGDHGRYPDLFDMIKPTSILFFCVALAFSLATCNAQESQGVEGSNVHKSPETLFAEFAGIYNSGEGDLLPLLSKKTKALGLFSGVFCCLGMGSTEQKEAYSAWSEKWKAEYFQNIKDVKLDTKDVNYSAVVIPLSKWDKLDDCFRDFAPNDIEKNEGGRGDGARYDTKLIDLEVDESRAKGSVRLFVNGGIVAGLNGNSLNWIDLKPIQVYFIKVDSDWYVCNEAEYSGKYVP